MLGKQPDVMKDREVRHIADLLLVARVDDTVTFAQINAVVGRDLLRRGERYLIHKAMKIANGEVGALFESVRKVGYKRLHGSRAQDVGRRTRKRVKRITNGATKMMTCALVLTNDISPEDRLAGYAEQASLGLLNHLARDRNVVRLHEPMEGPPSTMEAAAAAIEAMRKRRSQTG